MSPDQQQHHTTTAAYDAHQAPVPPPPRPPRPVKVPGHLLTASSTAEAAEWLDKQVFFTNNRDLHLSIRQRHPIFLLDAERSSIHGVYQRTADTSLLLADLTQAPGPQGYEVHVEPLYAFPVALDLDTVDDLLIQQPSSKQQQQQNGTSPKQQQQWQPMLGSVQHGALWEAFMKKAKKHQQHTAMEPIDEEQQQQQQPEGFAQPPPPPPRRPAAAAPAPAAAAVNGGS